MARVALTLACGAYDRTTPLGDGRVQPDGIDLTVLYLQPEECFFRMVRHGEFDVAEMSLSTYVMLTARGDDRFVAIPVPLSRSFRHNALYVRDGGPVRIGSPQDLAGRRIGVPEYQMTASVWTRGLLAHDLGVDLDGVTWVTGGLEQPGRVEREPLRLTRPIAVEPLAGDRTLTQALVDGEVDALMAPRVPSAFRRTDTPLRRLLPDYAERELASFRATGIFPIMHVVVLRRDVHERLPWAARSLTAAFGEAKRMAVEGAADTPALPVTMPFLLAALEAQADVFGPDPWPYGLPANRGTLDVFLEHMREQGLLEAALTPDDLFTPSTLEQSKI